MTKEQLLDFGKKLEIALIKKYPDIPNINTKIAQAISTLKGEGLPEDSDTLKELADKIVAQAVADTTLSDRITTLENKPAVSGLGNLTTDEIVALFAQGDD